MTRPVIVTFSVSDDGGPVYRMFMRPTREELGGGYFWKFTSQSN